MALPVLLQHQDLPQIPDDEVHVSVEVDRTHCQATDIGIQTRLSALEQNGFTVPVSRIVCYAAADFHGGVRDVYGLGTNRTRIIEAWHELVHWNPTSRLGHDGVSRLVLDQLPNPGRQRRISELLGVGVGLYAAKLLFERPFRFWQNQGQGRFDYRAPAPTGHGYFAEVRGRFGRNQWSAATEKVYEKLASPAVQGATHAAGFLYAPRVTANPLAPDLRIIDPNDEGEPVPLAVERALLRHYAPLFGQQGGVVATFGDRLAELARIRDDDLRVYLEGGDDVLRQSAAGRTSFRIGREEFHGSAWEGSTFPRHLTRLEVDVEGVFIEGIWSRVVGALREGRLGDIARMEVKEWSFQEEGRVYVVVDDARAYAWAPDLRSLMEMP